MLPAVKTFLSAPFVPCTHKHCLDQLFGFFKKRERERRRKKNRSVAKSTMIFNRSAKLLKRFPKSYFKIATLISAIAKQFHKSQRNVTLLFKNLSSLVAVKLSHSLGEEARRTGGDVAAFLRVATKLTLCDRLPLLQWYLHRAKFHWPVMRLSILGSSSCQVKARR